MKFFQFGNHQGIQSFFEEHGWVHIKNIFSKEEIINLREKAMAKQTDEHKGDLLSYEGTNSILSDKRIVKLIREILGCNRPVYFGDSNCMIGSKGARGFHKDNPDKLNDNGPDWKSAYTIIRGGIYLQDHMHHSACLALRDKSHLTVETEKGTPFCVANEPGDMVFWNLRTSHSGNSNRLKYFPNYFVKHRYYRILPKFTFLPEEKERISYFMTFAKEKDNHLKRYLKYLQSRTYMVEAWQNSDYEKSSLIELKKNFDFIDMNKIAKGIDLKNTNKNHVELQ